MSTWGYLRYLLLQSTPGLSLDLVDGWMNQRYTSVLAAADWTGIHATATIETQAAYLSTTDTATFTVGSTAVVGVGTAWASGIVGQHVYRPGDQAIYTVAARGSSTTLTLDRPYEGNGIDAAGVVYAAATYVFMVNTYALPSDCKTIERILNPLTEYPLKRFTQAEMDASAGPLTQVGEPQSWTEVQDQPEVDAGAAPLHQIMFYPAPLLERGYPLEYLRNPYAFSGTNLLESPLPFVTDMVILEGARADIALDAGKIAIAAGHEALFKAELARMLFVEFTQRRKKPVTRMASRFTRHRIERVERGDNRHGW